MVAEFHLRAGRISLVTQWICNREADTVFPKLMSGWGAYARGEVAREAGSWTEAFPWYQVAMDAADLPGGPVKAAIMAVEVQRKAGQDLTESMAGLLNRMEDGVERYLVQRALAAITGQQVSAVPPPGQERELVARLQEIGDCNVCVRSLVAGGEDNRIYLCFTGEHAVCQRWVLIN